MEKTSIVRGRVRWQSPIKITIPISALEQHEYTDITEDDADAEKSLIYRILVVLPSYIEWVQINVVRDIGIGIERYRELFENTLESALEKGKGPRTTTFVLICVSVPRARSWIWIPNGLAIWIGVVTDAGGKCQTLRDTCIVSS